LTPAGRLERKAMATRRNYLSAALSDEDYAEMIRRMHDRRIPTMAILQWLREKGYSGASRTAVYNRRKRLTGFLQLEEAIPLIRDQDLRSRVAEYVRGLRVANRY